MPLSCVCKIVKQYGKISWLKFEALPIFFCLEKLPPVCCSESTNESFELLLDACVNENTHIWTTGWYSPLFFYDISNATTKKVFLKIKD
ncbi:hypothetical protein PMEGAS67_53260 [Priestia megaterium]